MILVKRAVVLIALFVITAVSAVASELSVISFDLGASLQRISTSRKIAPGFQGGVDSATAGTGEQTSSYGHFQLHRARLNVDGELSEHFNYRFRLNLKDSLDVELFYLSSLIMDVLLLKLGKIRYQTGTFEHEYYKAENPPFHMSATLEKLRELLLFSDGIQLGLGFEDHIVNLQIVNTHKQSTNITGRSEAGFQIKQLVQEMAMNLGYQGSFVDDHLGIMVNAGTIPNVPRQSIDSPEDIDPSWAYTTYSLGLSVDISVFELEMESTQLSTPKHKRLVNANANTLEDINAKSYSSNTVLFRSNVESFSSYPFLKYSMSEHKDDGKKIYDQTGITLGLEYFVEKDMIKYHIALITKDKKYTKESSSSFEKEGSSTFQIGLNANI